MLQLIDNQLSHITKFLKDNKYSKVFVLVDTNTERDCLPKFSNYFDNQFDYEVLSIKAGEINKNYHSAVDLWLQLATFKADRNSVLINLGGGMITDLGGFVASTYKRGIDFIHIPTSLLSMCDASIGGKTAIDLGDLKNMVGTFTQPKKIYLHPEFLTTLPHSEVYSGLAEMIKHGLVYDRTHYEEISLLDKNSPTLLLQHIRTSMGIKLEIVNQDFTEQHIRKLLNFGHTFGHAIESLFLESGEPITHGEAVIIGIYMESYLSFLEGLLSKIDLNNIIKTLNNFYSIHSIKHFKNNSIIKKMQNDKKNTSDKINFTLLKGIGNGIYDYNCSLSNIEKSILFYKNLL